MNYRSQKQKREDTQPEAKTKTEYIKGEEKNGKAISKAVRPDAQTIREADIKAPDARAEAAFREYQAFIFNGVMGEAERSQKRVTRLAEESPAAEKRVRELEVKYGTEVLPEVKPTEQPTAQPEDQPQNEQQKPASRQAEQAQEPAPNNKGVEMISKAIETALNAHQGQPRKGTEIPYSTHPLAVGIILAKAGCTDEVIAAGILHDTVEDTNTRFDDLRVKFGAKVATIVEGCSEPNKKAEWEERKQHTIDFLKGASPDIKFVSLADKFHNISSMASDYAEVGERLWDRFNAVEEKQKWYYEGLVNALSDDSADGAYKALHKEFARTVEAVFGAPETREKMEKLPGNPSEYLPTESKKPISERPKLKLNPRTESIRRSALKGWIERLSDPKNDTPVWAKRAQKLRKKLGN